jgi:hypothetical protein
MPTRLIREGIITSKPVAALVNDASWFGEVFYRRLHQLVDDFGRYTADPALLRVYMFPLHIDKVREADCTRLLVACEKAGLIRLYAVDGKRYLEVLKFDQRMRAQRSKYPAPADTCPSHDGHMPVTCRTSALGDGDGGAAGFGAGQTPLAPLVKGGTDSASLPIQTQKRKRARTPDEKAARALGLEVQ